jgi:dephospho-CoA kinase
MTKRESRGRSPLPPEPARRAWSREGGNAGVVTVGLTGGIGAGKSTALAIFGELGAITMSADQLVHELYARPFVATEVEARFGSSVLDPHGRVDTRLLAEAVRGRRRDLRWLEKLTHPLVAEEIERRIGDAPAGTVVVCEVPLLFESGFERLFDLVVTIEAGGETRRRRSTHGFDVDMFSELEALQASSERRVAGSDLSFFNDGDREELWHFVQEAYGRALGMLEERR